jgi:uncharacterized protein (DUF3820 family)
MSSEYVGDPVFKFGKWHGRSVSEVAEDDPKYLRWLIATDFLRAKYGDRLYRAVRAALIKHLVDEIEAEKHPAVAQPLWADLI